MPHISQKNISEKLLKEIVERMYTTLRSADREAMVIPIFRELTTYTEKIMFAKRITMIFLLSKGVLFEDIWHLLQVSPTTLSKFSLALEKGQYNQLLKALKKGGVDELIEKILRAGLPPRGKGRWDFLKQYR